MINTHPYPNNGSPQNHILTYARPANGHDKALKILMLEDNENDAELIRMYLNSSKLNIDTLLVSNKEDYINTLHTQDFDVILSDHNIPQFSSLEALRIRNKIKFHIPFILVSGAIPEEYAVTILHEGANDYILKDRPQRLVTAITEAIKKQKALSDKILAEQELIEITERLKLVGKATADAIWDWNILTNQVYRGEGFQKLFGFKLNGNKTDLANWLKNIHPEDKERVTESMERFLKSKSANWREEFRYIKADGSVAVILDKGIALRDENGKAYRMVGATQDITHVRELELEIQEQKLKHQRENTEIAIQSQEDEREHIAKELHDNINQLMAFAKMMLDTARNSPDIREMCIDKSYEGINLAIEEVRKLSHSMVAPAYNENYTFADAVKEIVANIMACNEIKIKVKILPDRINTIADKKISLTFYRIIQEQLNNILKYARATKVEISLQEVNKVYRLLITDNGIGFDTTKQHKGIGLRNIESRAEVHGGNMEISSAPGEGCTLKIEIPIT